MQMKYFDSSTLLASRESPTGRFFAHAVETDAGHVPGMLAVLSTMFADSEIDRGRELRLRVFRTTAQAGQTKGSSDEPSRSCQSLVASAALFVLDQKLIVVDVVPGTCMGSTPAKGKLSADEYRVVSNAIIDLAFDEQIQLVYFPTTSTLSPRPPGSVPYEVMSHCYEAKLRRTLGKCRHWLVKMNDDMVADQVVRLNRTAETFVMKQSVSLVHTFHNIGPGDADAYRRLLGKILDTAKRRDVPLTLCVPGSLFDHTRSLLSDSSPHSLAFCGAGRPGDLLCELSRLRRITPTVRGYRPPHKAWIPEIADRTLSYFDFSWVLHKPIDGHCRVAAHRHGIVRLPVTVDDASLVLQGVSKWISAALSTLKETSRALVELASDRASHWLPEYDMILQELRTHRAVRLCEDVVADAWRIDATGDTPDDLHARYGI